MSSRAGGVLIRIVSTNRGHHGNEPVNGGRNKIEAERKAVKVKGERTSRLEKLPLLSQHVIRGLQAQFADDLDEDELEDVVVPDGPNILMLTVIRCSTGARVQQLLNHTLSVTHNCIVCLNMGMCTALKNGLLLS